LRIADKLDRKDVGVTFNLCHWLKVDGLRDPEYVLRRAVPRLMFVTINGADSGETQKKGWKQLIQPLGSGTYDVTVLLRILRAAGYRGPIGLQGFGIGMDSRELLTNSIRAWNDIQANVIAGEESTREQIGALLRAPDLSPSLSSEEVSGSLAAPGESVDETLSHLTVEGAVSFGRARKMLATKFPEGSKLTLYSLHPDNRNVDGKYADLPRFHDYPILGEVSIADADEANRWVRFLRDQVIPGGTFACGFEPRHGFRLSGPGGDIDILMCYACQQLALFNAGKMDGSVNPVLSGRSRDIVNRLFDKAGVPRDQPKSRQHLQERNFGK
jgi:hypothetical protein